ncbi:unnamed protein product [Schistocephalus solidus]|uniref:Endo/exonuclease/phosphatase domain-containing protein n=1 Tax=Schistocephalus solidus TaxID=70667 RepID=A0A183T779_SCHSO|nr:unnamed protein product [Schistocephalus solidus]
MHPRSRHWHLLDYVHVWRRDQQDVLVTKALPGADGLTDHCLVISKIGLHLQPHRRPQDNRPQGNLNPILLNVPIHYLHFSNELANRIAILLIANEDASVDNRWCQLRDTAHSTTLDDRGRARRQHQDGFDGNDAAINAPLAAKNRLYKNLPRLPYCSKQDSFLPKSTPCRATAARDTGRLDDPQG